MTRKLRLVVGSLIIALTVAAFGWYIYRNPAVVQQLRHTSPATIVLLCFLYFCMLGSLMLVLRASLQLYQKPMSGQENFMLSSYSSLVNFFGPGQSGPGFRAAYLKMKHGVLVKQYLFATLLYYACYAFFSGLLLVAAVRPWWQTVLLAVAIVAISFGVIKVFVRRNAGVMGPHMTFSRLVRIGSILAFATLLQVLIFSLIYYVELHSLEPSVTFSQAAAYTGAANFALFVALTPGAIGIREAFLLFSQNLHHMSNDVIVAANVLDRAVYLIFLVVLFIAVLALHADRKLQVTKLQLGKQPEA